MKISVDTERKEISLDGLVYSFEIFEALARLPIGTKLEIISRNNHEVTIRKILPEISTK